MTGFDVLLACAGLLSLALFTTVATIVWHHRKPAPRIATDATAEVLSTCTCTDCLNAAQPAVFVQVGTALHVVQRDSICHEYSSACVCRPQASLASFGPLLVHSTVQRPGAAA